MTCHNESEAMAEIRKIRAEIYEEIKNLSPHEQVDKAKRESEEFEKEFCLKLPRISKSKERSA
jgi:ribosome recycling factor